MQDSNCRLASIYSSSGLVLDKIRKNILALVKNEGLSITIETNRFETDYLDVTFYPITETIFLFKKPNKRPLHVNAIFTQFLLKVYVKLMLGW